MSTVITDTEDVRTFLDEMRNQVSQIESLGDQVRSRFGSLADVWRDREYDRFEEILGETLRMIRDFRESAEEQAQHLEGKLQALEDTGWAG